MMTYAVLVECTQERYLCSESETLLAGMEKLGRRAISVGCRGGGCGVCKIEVVCGSYSTRRMSRAHVSEKDELNGRVLACCVRPASDIVFRVIGRMKTGIPRGESPKWSG